MKKIQKGFTIIEVLAVIVVLTLLTVLIVPNIINTTSNKILKISEVSKKIIYDAADIYVKNNKVTYPIAEDATYCIKLEELVKSGNLVAPIKDLKTNKEVPLNYYVQVTLDSYEQYRYELVKNCTFAKGIIKDNTPPTIANVALKTKTSNSITVAANGYDDETGIAYYQFSKDNGTTWEPNTPQQSNEYTFSNLISGTYEIKSRVINSTYETKGLTDDNYKDSNKNEITTGTITAPTYSINITGWQISKIVTINFGDSEEKYNHYYQKDNGEWTLVNGNTQNVTFVANGTVVAKVTDGINEVSSSYSVSEIDTTAPIIQSVTPSTVWDYSNSVVFTAKDNESQILGYNVTETNSEPSNWIPVTSFVEQNTETKYAYNAAWARVFHQNAQGGYTLFSNETEALSANTDYKYSVLENLNNYKNSSNKWEFLLEYPEISRSEYNRWKQSSNPATTNVPDGDGSEKATGYEAVHVDWDGVYWGGLGKSSVPENTFIDGSYGHANWYYAIGSYVKYQDSIPAIETSNTSIVNLWTRIDDKPTTFKSNLTAKVGDLSQNKTYYLWVKDRLGNVRKQAFTTSKVDTNTLSAPTVSGGSTTWIYGSKAFTLTAPSSSSGIKMYEYFISNTNTQLQKKTKPTGNSSSTSITISDPGKYIYFRAINNAGVVSEWTDAKNLYIYESTSFSATSTPQTYTVPKTGKYKIELWGAQGYSAYGGSGGKGGYVSGIINLTKNTNLYFYVGNQGDYTTSAWNGAGICHKNGGGNCGSSGGGGVDVRTVKGTAWNEAASLRSRIMVAGSGGGAGGTSTAATYYTAPGVGGGLVGGSSAAYNTNYTASTGGNQTAGGYSTYSGNTSYVSDSYGTFGMGPYTDNDKCCGASGGSGWYGGGGGCGNSAGGGSAYISGHTGCVAVTSTSSSSPKSGCTTGSTNNSCSVSPYGYTFTSTKIIDGAGYNWTTTKGSYVGQPQPDGTTAAGHTGSGYARITYMVD